MIRPHRCRTPQELASLRTILKMGCRARSDRYYIHQGDLNWWLYYSERLEDEMQNLYIWQERGSVKGWALLSPSWRTFDVFIHPDLADDLRAEEFYTWAQRRVTRLVAARGGKDIRTYWVAEGDDRLRAMLESQNFHASGGGYICMVRNLNEPLSEPELPEGFHARWVAGESEAHLRAAASHGAFGSDWSMDRYLQRYLNFMRSPVYIREMDMVITAPDGRHAAFCILWPDSLNHTGLFEPVGTHPDFRRQGLGKAIMLSGLQQLKERGMQSARVTTEAENLPARRLYDSVGFQEQVRLVTYVKEI